ncbi:MAG TPA: TRZ/ATZ family hydrolase [Burkholderiales bacterium]|nr:TRZ/ATZ family hydrolase [Burkholderiales bacterium]
MQTRIPVDLMVDARWIVPVEPARTVLHAHSLVATAGRIEAVLPTAEAHARYAAVRHLALHGHALIPGLVNLHTHAAMTLMRGLADDLPLMEWLKNHIWPAETRHASPEFVGDGTRLACAEMLRGGVTCFNDMYFYPEAAAAAALEAGMRAAIGMIVVDFPTPYASDPDDYLNKGLQLRDQHRGNPLLRFCMAPHAPYTVSDKTFARVVTYAEQLQVPIHIHLHETSDEIRESLEHFGVRPLERLRALGMLGPNLIAVHMVHLSQEEVDLVAKQRCAIAHCPSSNLKLASGIEPPVQLLAHGIPIGLGTDGAASNNRLDMFEEMRLAALIAKVATRRADTLPAHQVLEMATLNGARALGWESEIGSLLPGKAADVVAVDLSALEVSPCYEPVSHLVYAAGRQHVSHVWVAGRLLVEEGRLTSLSERALLARAEHWRSRIKES